jgi:hypothetical protein
MIRRPLLALAVAAVIASACVGCATASPVPPWVAGGVQTLRAQFKGNPEPIRVAWGIRSKQRWVTIYLSHTDRVISDGPRGSIVTGSHATITWYLGTSQRRYSVRIR